jgi:hypothetical protein
MANPYRGGAADCWYSAKGADLWIEYKFIPKIPLRAAILPACSALQLEWLRDRHAEHRNVAVILGCPEGGVVYEELSWEKSKTPIEYRSKLRSKRELAEWITNKTKGEQART